MLNELLNTCDVKGCITIMDSMIWSLSWRPRNQIRIVIECAELKKSSLS